MKDQRGYKRLFFSIAPVFRNMRTFLVPPRPLDKQARHRNMQLRAAAVVRSETLISAKGQNDEWCQTAVEVCGINPALDR